MAGENKMEEVDFETLEDFKIEVPTMNDKAIMVQSNGEMLSDKIRAVVKKYGDVQLTQNNVGYVKTLKSHFVSLRTSIERERKEWVKIYLDPAKKTVQGICDELLALVNEGESKITKQLEEYDQKRKDALKLVLDGYREEAIAKYGLTDEFAGLIVLKDKYFNKTQDEGDSADDIEEQAKEAKKKQDEKENSIKLIEAECEGSDLIPDAYISQLAYRNAMELVLQIKQDKKKLAQIQEERQKQIEEQGKATVGEKVPDDLFDQPKEEKKDTTKRVRLLRIVYRKEQASLIKDFLEENHIDYEFIKED